MHNVQMVMSDAELYNVIGTKVRALRQEADQLEQFAEHSLHPSSPTHPTRTIPVQPVVSEESEHETKTKSPKLLEKIRSIITANGGVMERREIIKVIKSATKGKTSHIAVVACLRNASAFKDQGNGLFSVV